MSDPVSKVKELYAAFGRGDAEFILSNITDDCSWEFEAPAVLSWAGIRRGPKEAAGFFAGIAAEHADPVLNVTTYLSSGDEVATFGRYDATVKATGVRVSTPLAHYFKFRDGKVSRYVNYINSGAFVEAAQKG
jgi:ketosteroid isomerase-like protein